METYSFMKTNWRERMEICKASNRIRETCTGLERQNRTKKSKGRSGLIGEKRTTSRSRLTKLASS